MGQCGAFLQFLVDMVHFGRGGGGSSPPPSAQATPCPPPPVRKRARSHDTITKFWATLYFHLAQSMDKYEHRPVAQYESTNKIRLGFVSKLR